MKKILVLLAFLFPACLFAQKFAYVDTQYILGKLPNYKSASDQVEKVAAQYQKEIEDGYKKLDEMYKSYQAEKALLNDNMRKKREDDIISRERELKDLQQKYFSPDGAVFKKRTELLKPIQDQVSAAIKSYSEENNYSIIFDSANNTSMVYANPRSDVSDKILDKLGFK